MALGEQGQAGAYFVQLSLQGVAVVLGLLQLL